MHLQVCSDTVLLSRFISACDALNCDGEDQGRSTLSKCRWRLTTLFGPEAATTVARSARAGISNLTRSFIQKKNNSGEQSSPAGSRAVGNMGSSKPPPSGLDGIFARMNSDGTSSTRRAESNSDRIDDDTDDGGLLGSQPDSLYGAAGSSGGWLPRRR